MLFVKNIINKYRMKLYKLDVTFENGSRVVTLVKGRSYTKAKERFNDKMPIRLAFMGIKSHRGFRVVNIELIDWCYF